MPCFGSQFCILSFSLLWNNSLFAHRLLNNFKCRTLSSIIIFHELIHQVTLAFVNFFLLLLIFSRQYTFSVSEDFQNHLQLFIEKMIAKEKIEAHEYENKAFQKVLWFSVYHGTSPYKFDQCKQLRRQLSPYDKMSWHAVC